MLKLASMLKRILEVDFFLANVLVPLIALVLYCGSFAHLSSLLLLDGVNQLFASKLERYAFLLAVAAALLFAVIFMTSKNDRRAVKYFPHKFYPDDLLLLLLPLTPIAQYVLNNQEILSPLDSLYVIVIFAAFSGFYILVVPAVFGIVIPARTLMVLGLAFVYTIANMASVSGYFNWFEKGTLKIQLRFLGSVFAVAWLFYYFDKRRLFHVLVLLSFIANSSAQWLVRDAAADDPPLLIGENKLLPLVQNRTPVVTPNVYLLVYDAYVPNETMLQYGIDNSSQEDYLTAEGFQLYPHTYSIGSATVETMSKVLNASNGYYGDHRKGVAGDGVVHEVFRDLGYETYGLFYSDYMFRGHGESYDYSFPENTTPSSLLLLKAIFIGEFIFDIENVGFREHTRDEFVETKREIFQNAYRGKVFIYMHTNLPSHSQNSGACRSDETRLYKERLTAANLEMRQDLDLIIRNDPGAIVIVAGDHGPFLTKNCWQTTDIYNISEITRLDIQDRNGTFLAIRWPTDDFVEYDDIVVLQDLFPVVFAYLYEDVTILDAKVEPVIPVLNRISGASVNNGVIDGGIDDGEPLFLSGQ
jgi:hypothetical protein